MKLVDHCRNLEASLENEILLMTEDGHFEDDLLVRCAISEMEDGLKRLRGIVDILKED